MRISTIAAAATLAGGLAATPALAISEGAVNYTDIAQVSAAVETIADTTDRAVAEQKLRRASEALIERNQLNAYVALQDALALAGGTQVTQR